ncbi:hypothetical protein ACFYVL_28940 [Streptomyces sp. NPDC004111]|uniref:hypothetical protein n=1 Tax=Streptomyces sp. NPDC004111 TaxID=3364690 RepID=UPI003679ACFE
MSDNETNTVSDPLFIEEFTELIRRTAATICAEQPDIPEPEELSDLDSFSMVQVVLDLENALGVKVLEQLEGFGGRTFRELAELIEELAHREDASAALVAAVKERIAEDSVDTAR